jgi:5-hydroxyisourate hydrolase-like protein (transthyretin family)
VRVKRDRLRRARLTCIATVCLSIGGCAARVEPPTGVVTGQVVDARGQGLADAKVDILADRGEEILATTLTRADGQFELGSAPIGCRARLTVEAASLGRDFRDGLFVFPNQTTDVGQIAVYPGCVCRGRIVDNSGRPLGGAEVVIQPYSHQLAHTIQALGAPMRTTSDDDGRFSTPPLPPSLAVFNIRPAEKSLAAGHRAHNIDPTDGELQLPDVVLLPDVRIEGVVTDRHDRPIAGAEVWARGRMDDSDTTDDQGRFVLHGANAKTAAETILGVDADGFGSYVEEEPGGAAPRKIVLTPCYHITGRAVDVETNEPVEITRVVVCDVSRAADGSPRSSGCGEARFEQPRKGQFKAQVSSAGEKHVTVSAAGYHDGEEYALEFTPGRAEQNITVRLRRQGSSASAASQRIHGVVRAKGRPAARVWVSLWQKKDEWAAINAGMRRGRTVDYSYRPWRIDVLTAADGSYSLDVTEPGDYYVTAIPWLGAPAVSPPLTVAASESLDCNLDLPAGGVIRGRVIGVEPDIAERLWAVAFGRSPYCAAAKIDRNGEFVFPDVPPIEIGVKVGHEGYLDADVVRFPWNDEDAKKTSEPWSRATIVTIKPEQEVHIEVDYPAPGPPDELDR